MPANPATLIDSKLIDSTLSDLQSHLESKLSWLDKAYGKAQRLVEIDDNGREYYYPVFYVSGLEYERLEPSDKIGACFSFFVVDERQEVSENLLNYIDLEVSVGLILWYDFRHVYSIDWEQRTEENVKFDVLTAISTVESSQTFQVNSVSERAENVYSEFSIRELDKQFRMRPYGCLRFDMTITIQQIC